MNSPSPIPYSAASSGIRPAREPPRISGANGRSSNGDDVRWVARRASELCQTVRVVIAPHIPSGVVSLLAGTGILALRAAPDTIRLLQGQPSVGLKDAVTGMLGAQVVPASVL